MRKYFKQTSTTLSLTIALSAVEGCFYILNVTKL